MTVKKDEQQQQATTTQVAVSRPATGAELIQALAPDLFKDIDFSGLSKAIDNIGGTSTKLGKNEKNMANDIVAQWEQDVIKRLGSKEGEMNRFINFFEAGHEGKVNQPELFDDLGADMADKTNTVAEYTTLIAAIEKLEELQRDRPIKPVEDLSRMKSQELQDTADYELAKAKFEIAITKQKRVVYLAEVTWKKLLRNDKVVANMIKEAKKFTKNIGNLKQECRDKSQLAKLNITVSDATVRQSLKELLEFSTKM